MTWIIKIRHGNPILMWGKYGYFCFAPNGFEFNYHGDSVMYIYPWKRDEPHHKWISISFMAHYPSLKAIDDEWDGYFKACQDGN